MLNSYRLDFVQPLFVPNALRLSLERARLNLDESRRRFTAAQLDIVYDVTAEFFGFLRAERRLEIARSEVAQQEEAFQLASRKFTAGLIPEVEALQMEVDLAQSRNDLLAAEGARATAADRFKLRLGLPLDQDIAVEAEATPAFYEVDADRAREHALAHRAEIRNTEADLRRAEITVAETDARSALKGEIRAYYDLTGVGTQRPVPGPGRTVGPQLAGPGTAPRQPGRGVHAERAPVGQRRQRRRGGRGPGRARTQRSGHATSRRGSWSWRSTRR